MKISGQISHYFDNKKGYKIAFLKPDKSGMNKKHNPKSN